MSDLKLQRIDLTDTTPPHIYLKHRSDCSSSFRQASNSLSEQVSHTKAFGPVYYISSSQSYNNRLKSLS